MELLKPHNSKGKVLLLESENKMMMKKKLRHSHIGRSNSYTYWSQL